MVDKWLAGALVLALFLATGTGLIYLFLNRIARLDTATAYFSSTPGGFSEMVQVGESLGADVRAVSGRQPSLDERDLVQIRGSCGIDSPVGL